MSNAAGKTVLVVDDSLVVRRVVRKIVERIGFTALEAGDGQQALDACRRAIPDAVLLDWNMPVMSGLEFLAEVRKIPGGDTLTVVMCTTEVEYAHIQEALAAGADEYIMKPFDSDIIASKLAACGVIDPPEIASKDELLPVDETR